MGNTGLQGIPAAREWRVRHNYNSGGLRFPCGEWSSPPYYIYCGGNKSLRIVRPTSRRRIKKMALSIPAGRRVTPYCIFITFVAKKKPPMKFAYTYIMTNKRHTTLYTGCTNDLVRRVSEHKSHKYKGSFTDKYNCEYCVYYKEFTRYQSAIDEENRIKHMTRAAKIELIEGMNPEWKELVTEKGFAFDKTLWSERVKRVFDELLGDKR